MQLGKHAAGNGFSRAIAANTSSTAGTARLDRRARCEARRLGETAPARAAARRVRRCRRDEKPRSRSDVLAGIRTERAGAAETRARRRRPTRLPARARRPRRARRALGVPCRRAGKRSAGPGIEAEEHAASERCAQTPRSNQASAPAPRRLCRQHGQQRGPRAVPAKRLLIRMPLPRTGAAATAPI